MKNLIRTIAILVIIFKSSLLAQPVKTSFGLKYNLVTSEQNYNKFLLRDLYYQGAHIRFYSNYGMSLGGFKRISLRHWDLNIGPNVLLRRWAFLSDTYHNIFPPAVNENTYYNSNWQESNIWTIELPLTISIPIKLTDNLFLKPILGYSLDFLIPPNKDLINRPIKDSSFSEILQLKKSRKLNHAGILGLCIQNKSANAGSLEVFFLVHLQMFNQIYFTHGTNPEKGNSNYFTPLETRHTNQLKASYTSLGLSWCFPY